MVFMQLSPYPFTPMTHGSTKVPSGGPGQVDFLAGQVTFKAYLPNGQRPKQVIPQLKNLRAACPKEKPEFKFFFFQALMTLVKIQQNFQISLCKKILKRQNFVTYWQRDSI